MLKKVALLAAMVTFACIMPASAQEATTVENPWLDSPGAGANNGDAQGNFTYKTDGKINYEHEHKGRLVQGVYRKAQETTRQATANGLQTSMGGPLIFFGQNTMIAPQNMALQVEKGRGGRLPQTGLDSFVAQAQKNGMAFMIYGDEGTSGPPPLSFFQTIQSGGVSATTGHQSDAPSAWY
jgi:hypothetical protein